MNDSGTISKKVVEFYKENDKINGEASIQLASDNVTSDTSIEKKKSTVTRFCCPTKACVRRIHQDLKSIYRNPLHGIFVIQDETRVNLCHALINGPVDTPYEFGFFYFQMEFPDDYPYNPPIVLLKTTGGGKVRFNPNLYKCGKVCLSILGTWAGPGWSPVQTIGSTLLSIQSLLNPAPFHNEPGLEDKVAHREKSRCYNQFIRHETIRVAIIDLLESSITNTNGTEAKNAQHPPSLEMVETIKSSFLDFAEILKYTCDEYSFLDGRQYKDPFCCTNHGVFRFSMLRSRIEELEERFLD
mmetsp:Transcript_8039/g.11647  ORF Transcript_8039/g.11647 Transcript_8039/m.11647 type:complete len:299 (-) Transcript_8039:1353-2249(-)|eukprot:CAMPEP_0194258994 /NCGR_PEP_ID=MMETSP0158-20130606/42542_1 /TAXON_ID=33649 /ORGANISM="Thalassionema nitzschioides, Strain L26-B" /LENGTH=298 /DNA_ID=CAMNT_0038998605 /DNA_START=38 /DNA_END=934 /DNA_ORIENTATION=+